MEVREKFILKPKERKREREANVETEADFFFQKTHFCASRFLEQGAEILSLESMRVLSCEQNVHAAVLCPVGKVKSGKAPWKKQAACGVCAH